MSLYYVNKNAQDSGEHEVHKESCNYLPSEDNLIYLGDFPTCAEAIREAKKHYPDVDGCYYCCFPCNKKDRNLKKDTLR
ncbi:MAG: hypothetical protein WC679_08830 [Bacteroidales bacterium]|jgi:hypothetical protein